MDNLNKKNFEVTTDLLGLFFQDSSPVQLFLGMLVPLALVLMALWLPSFLRIKKKKNSSDDSYLSVPKAAEKSPFKILSMMQSVQSPFFLLEQARQCGSFVYELPLPGGKYIVVGDARVARQVLTDPDSEKTGFFAGRPSKTSGSVTIFTSFTSSEHWKWTRKGVAPAFSSRQVHRMRSVARKHLEQWVEDTLDPLVENGGTFDPNREMTRLTLRIIIEAAFEYHATEEEIDVFLSEIEVCLREFSFRQMFNPIRRNLEWCFPKARQAHASAKKIQAFARTILEAYRSKQGGTDCKKSGVVSSVTDEKKDDSMSDTKENDDDRPNTVIRLIVENPHLTDSNRIGEMITFLVAGYDTTGYTLSTCLYKLAEHPEIAKTLQVALKESEKAPRTPSSSVKTSSVKSSASFSSFSATGPEEAWRNCEYMQYVIKENFRILPVAALGSLREVRRDFVFTMPTKVDIGGNNTDAAVDDDAPKQNEQQPRQYMIPKGTRMIMPQTVIHHNDLIFDDPDVFDPTRWKNATPEMNQSIMTFAAGVRNCVGQSLATAEIQTILPRLFRHYTFAIDQPGEIDYFLTMKFANSRLSVKRVDE